jgi:uncharacterized membrane protein
MTFTPPDLPLDDERPGAVDAVTRDRTAWITVLIAALAGIAFTTIQIIDKIAILKNPGTGLVCDVNATLSCSGVIEAWQSSALGPPNALIGAIMFALLGSAALAGVLHSTLSRRYLATLWGLAVFFLVFASWFMYQTAFSIGRLCLWCIGITTAVVIICAALTRIANRAHAFGDGSFGRFVARTIHAVGDLIFWAAWWALIALMVATGLLLA